MATFSLMPEGLWLLGFQGTVRFLGGAGQSGMGFGVTLTWLGNPTCCTVAV